MPILIALLAGLVFGAGLTVSQMIDPAKVLAFLDMGGMLTGRWDPSLALVMGGALAVSAPAFLFAQKRGAPVCGGTLQLPTRRDADKRLAAGALLFGVGWGLVGYCPGPAVSALGLGDRKTLIFVACMIAGMALYEFTGARPARFASAADQGA